MAGEHAGPEAGVRFLAEAEAVARLHHPHGVQILAIGEHDGRPYLELEYAEGGSLEARLDGTPWPTRRAAELVEPLARAVAEAHRMRVVHRDLKPGNILLTADGTPKFADFGLAKSLGTESGLTRTDSVLGSPIYMAPEQAGGRSREVGPPSDVYSLGAIFYALPTGRPPFRASTHRLPATGYRLDSTGGLDFVDQFSFESDPARPRRAWLSWRGLDDDPAAQPAPSK